MACGSLVFYRWPPRVDWNEAPDACQEVLRGSFQVLRFGIWHSNQRGPVIDAWSPEVRTACAVVQPHRLSPAQVESLKQTFAEGALLCRFRDDVPSSAVIWLPGAPWTNWKGQFFMPIELNMDGFEGIPDVHELAEHKQAPLLQAICACIQAMDGCYYNWSMTTRRR